MWLETYRLQLLVFIIILKNKLAESTAILQYTVLLQTA